MYRAGACITIQKTVRMWLCRKKHKPRWVWPQKHHVTKVTNQIPDFEAALQQ